jgi:signal transduction histidine kinase
MRMVIGGSFWMWFRGLAGPAATALLLFAVLEPAAAAQPRRVLLLHSFGQHFHPWSAVAVHFREELIRHSPEPVDLYEASLDSARFSLSPNETPIVNYLRALFANHNLDLVVTLGAPAARFFQRNRPQFFPSTPMLITGADQRTFSEATLSMNDTAVPSTLDLPRLVENILQVLPDTKKIAFVIGASPLEQLWIDAMRGAFQPFQERVTFEWFNDLAADEMVKRAASMPPQSAIFYASVRVDALGVPNEQDRLLTRLCEAANAPIFSYVDSNFGRGIVGGPVISTEELGRKAAEVAVRILGGETAGHIKTAPVGLGVPTYDWRELQRWNIKEARLPLGSIVQFREPTVWERYRWQLSGVFLALLIQTAMITWLLIERYRRWYAEQESRRRLTEVMHLNRSAEVGALSAAYAHELGQPLNAIMLNADTAERLLSGSPQKDGDVKVMLADIRDAAEHAVDIIGHLRKLLKKGTEAELEEFDLRDVIADAVHILRPEATKRSLSLQSNGIEGRVPLLVRADRIHVQQVILNLANNAMDAMSDAVSTNGIMVIEMMLRGESQVEVSVSDCGTGIPEGKITKVFDTFYTTKKQGTGLGLSIARTIIETYGGRIWAENRMGGGAVFRFTLPLVRPSQLGVDIVPSRSVFPPIDEQGSSSHSESHP